MKSFADLLLEEGFSPAFTVEDTLGKFKDFNDDQAGKGGYFYEEIPHTLGTIKRLVYKIWSQMGRYKTVTHYPEGFGKNDLKEWKGRFDKDAYKVIEQIEAKHGRAALDAQEIIASAKNPSRAPAYLRNKGLSLLSGYLCDPANLEVMHIPLYGRDGKITSIQTIFPDDAKQFLPGGKISGSYGVIEGVGDTLFVCEGYATAASIHTATGATVAFVLSADNYGEGLPSILAKYRHAFRVIAADDDRHLKENLGFNKAFAAAARHNCLIRKPAFTEYKGKETTDFDDLRRESGIEAVAKQLEVTEAEKNTLIQNEGVFALGHDDSNYYFTSTENADIQSFSSMTKDSLFKLMSESWWQKRYGEEGTKGSIVKWDSVISSLYSACHAVGKFQDEKIRGVGVYEDAGRTVVHLGDRLLVDGREATLRGFPSSYTYLFNSRLPNIEPIGLSDEETQSLTALIDKLNLQEETAKLYLSGWMVCAILAGSLKWRPHLYVTGVKGSGKSTVLEFMDVFLSRGFKAMCYSAVTCSVAGIRQSNKASSVALIIDEIEGGKRMAGKVDDFITLFRVASSNAAAQSVVGTPGQKAIKTTVAFCGVLGGIVPQLETDQDRSRFAVIEFLPFRDPAVQSKQWEFVAERIVFCQGEDFSRKFVARVIHNAKTILANINTLTTALMKVEQARLAQQYGALLAASLVMKHTQPISDEEIEDFKRLVVRKDSTISHSSEATSTDDLLDQILSATIFNEDNSRTTVRRELVKQEPCDRIREILGEYGVIVAPGPKGQKGIHIRSTSLIKKQLSDMPMYAKNYLIALQRMDGAVKSYQIRFQGTKYRGVWLPMEQVVEHSPDVIERKEQF